MVLVTHINNYHNVGTRSINIFILCILWIQRSSAKLEIEDAKTIYSVEAVQGGLANLPCDITPPEPGDQMHILIWYKGKSPVYTFDSRDKKLEQGKHWSDELVLGGRAYFRYQDEPAKLTLDSVKENDGGVYQCRVDFRRSPTRNVVVNLTVIIPPEKLSILNERGVHIPHYILGPYNEGASMNITCVATGGRPSPKVTWWQENALLDDSYEYLTEKRVRNILHLDQLERKHLHSVFTCQASNNNLIAPISSSVTLDMNLKPLWVKLLGTNKPLSAGNTYELSCEVVGSRPSPAITWWKGSIQMTDTRETTSPDSNTTTSVLTIIPSADDGGKYLSCRGQQPLIPNSAIEDGWRLDIYHMPLVTLELGSNLNARTIREGVDVYFECNIKSNPWVYKVSWKHNGKMLFNNGAAGTIVSNQSLVLQSVSRARAGTYTCIGSNHEGDGESNPVQLDVKFVPVCRPGQQKIYNVARQETVSVYCEVDANPTNVQFLWKFNNSDNSALMLDMPQNLISADKTKSTLLYTPMTEHDYGTLLCKGTNKIGQQRDPCVFYINPAGKPDSLSNCSVTNQTTDSIQVECAEGFDGGLPQIFVLELYDALYRKLISNVTSKNAEFFIGGLNPDRTLDIVLYAANKKGRSEIKSLQTFTLKSVEKRSASISSFLHLIPVLGILIGIVVALILVATIIVVVIRLRGREEDIDKNYDTNSLSASGSAYATVDSKNTSTEPLRTDLNISVNSLEEKNPDIIPHNNSEDDYQEEERAFERLNNAQSRTYIRLPTPNRLDMGSVVNYDGMEINKNQVPRLYYSQQPAPCLQPFSPPHPSTLQRMHHPHLLPAYISRTPREKQHVYDGSITSATPLISRENNILQPILVANSHRSPPIVASQSQVVTRF